MKKIGKYTLLILLLLGSMYLTNESMKTLKEEDPLMKEIKKRKDKYEITPVNAVIDKENMIPGIYGVEVNLTKTYHNMKKYGSYNESLTVLENKKPDISTEDHYEYYIEKGNPSKRQIALLFKVVEENTLEEILSILKKENVLSTFLIDGSLLEKEQNTIKKNLTEEYEILSFNESYQTNLIDSSISYLEAITNKKTKYCYVEKEDEKILSDCAKRKKHTIKQEKVIDKDLYEEVRNTLDNGLMITIEWNKNTKKELSSVIKHIKSKGYELVTLDELLKEE